MPRPPLGEKAMSDAERQRKHRERLQKERKAAGATKPASRELIEAREEIGRLRQRICDLETEFARVRRAAAETARATGPASPAEADRVIKRLRERNRDANAERTRTWRNQTGISEKGGMSFATHAKIIKILHPDSRPSEAERAEACTAFNAWTDDLKPARGR
jgi:hypothetical protein